MTVSIHRTCCGNVILGEIIDDTLTSIHRGESLCGSL